MQVLKIQTWLTLSNLKTVLGIKCDPKEGCTHSFQWHSSLEKHLAFGTCTKTVERETLLDKAKVKYAARLEEGSSSVPTIPLPPETCPRSTGYVTLPEGFALKQVKKVYRFNEKQRFLIISP